MQGQRIGARRRLDEPWLAGWRRRGWLARRGRCGRRGGLGRGRLGRGRLGRGGLGSRGLGRRGLGRRGLGRRGLDRRGLGRSGLDIVVDLLEVLDVDRDRRHRILGPGGDEVAVLLAGARDQMDRRPHRLAAERVEVDRAAVLWPAGVVDRRRHRGDRAGLLVGPARLGRRRQRLGRRLVVGGGQRRRLRVRHGRPGTAECIVVQDRRERRVGLGVDHRVDPLAPAVVVLADRLLEYHVVVPQRDVIDLDRHVELDGGLAEPDQAVDLAQQLAVGQRSLVDVVVGVDLEAAMLGEALGRHARGDQHDRHLAQRSFLAALEHLEPRLVGLLDRDHQQRRRGRHREHEGLVGVGLGRDLEPVASQLLRQRGSKRGVSVDQQDAAVHRRRSYSTGAPPGADRPPAGAQRCCCARAIRSVETTSRSSSSAVIRSEANTYPTWSFGSM